MGTGKLRSPGKAATNLASRRARGNEEEGPRERRSLHDQGTHAVASHPKTRPTRPEGQPEPARVLLFFTVLVLFTLSARTRYHSLMRIPIGGSLLRPTQIRHTRA